MFQPCDVVFCGNPGVGKSTLASCISGEKFESGVSFGAGLTCELKWNECTALPGIRFADTPGLDDPELREQAAEAINLAMTDSALNNRELRVIFVCTLEAGRVRPADMNTIKLVMSSITSDSGPPGRNSFGILINKCGFLSNPKFTEDQVGADGKPKPCGKTIIETMFATESAMVPVPTSHIKFVPQIDELVDADNTTTPLDDVRCWVFNYAPSITVIKSELIDVSSQEEQIEAMTAMRNEALQKMDEMSAQQVAQLEESRQFRAKTEERNQQLEAQLLDQVAKAEEAQQRHAKMIQDMIEEQSEAEKARFEQARLDEIERRKEEQARLDKLSGDFKQQMELQRQIQAEREKREEESKLHYNRLMENMAAEKRELAQQSHAEAIRMQTMVQAQSFAGPPAAKQRMDPLTAAFHGMTLGLFSG